jgi:uncharacterized Fe-S center protein
MRLAADVYLTPFGSAGESDNINRKVSLALGEAGFWDALEEADRVAVKIHPGERNNATYLRPTLVRSVIDRLAREGAHPFVTETTTLYCRERFTAEELTTTAAANGFSGETMGCPFVVADDEPDAAVSVHGKYLKEVGVAGAIARADALVVLTHVTGHSWTAGLAGSLKQLGMGCVGRAAKIEVHRATTITIDGELCSACGACADACKSEAILVGEDCAVLSEHCARCGVCIGSCNEGAIGYSHDLDRFARSLSEVAAGALSCFEPGRAVFVNFLTDVTWHCDCEGFSDRPIFPDLGVLVSTDPVAIDQASADLMNGADALPGSMADRPEIAGARDKLLALFGIEWWRQLEYAESLGMGGREYRLRRLEV